jgi:hypothetical protein
VSIEWIGYGLVLLALVCLVLPPRFDPAIRLKEWLDGRK